MKTTSYKGSDLSPQFKRYARKKAKLMDESFRALGGEVTDFNIGFYYWSGFGLVNGQYYYFSVSDCRSFSPDKLLIRTARDNKDYTGGTNHYLDLQKSLVSQLTNFIKP